MFYTAPYPGQALEPQEHHYPVLGTCVLFSTAHPTEVRDVTLPVLPSLLGGGGGNRVNQGKFGSPFRVGNRVNQGKFGSPFMVGNMVN